MPAKILTDKIEFKGKALGIPLLRKKINSLTGNLSEKDVVLLAIDVYKTYAAIYEKFRNDGMSKAKNISNPDEKAEFNKIKQECKDARRFIDEYKAIGANF